MVEYNSYEKSSNKPKLDFSSLLSTGANEESEKKSDVEVALPSVPKVEEKKAILENETSISASMDSNKEKEILEKPSKPQIEKYERRKGILRKQGKTRKYLPEREGKRITPTLPLSTVQNAKLLSLLIQENRDNCTDPNFDKAGTRRCDMTGITNAFFDVCLHLLGEDFAEKLPSNILNEVQLRDYILRKAKQKFSEKIH